MPQLTWCSRGRGDKNPALLLLFQCSFWYTTSASHHAMSVLDPWDFLTGFQVYLGARYLRMPDWWVPDYLGFNEQGNWNQSAELEADEQATVQIWFNKVHWDIHEKREFPKPRPHRNQASEIRMEHRNKTLRGVELSLHLIFPLRFCVLKTGTHWQASQKPTSMPEYSHDYSVTWIFRVKVRFSKKWSHYKDS